MSKKLSEEIRRWREGIYDKRVMNVIIDNIKLRSCPVVRKEVIKVADSDNDSVVTRICPSCREQVNLEDYNEGSEECIYCEDLENEEDLEVESEGEEGE